MEKRALFAKRIADLNHEYHEYVFEAFTTALPRIGLSAVEGRGHIVLSATEQAKLVEVVEKAKYAFLLPFAGFLQDKEMRVDAQDVDQRLSLELILMTFERYGLRIDRSDLSAEIQIAPPYEDHVNVAPGQLTKKSNVMFVDPGFWSRKKP